MIIVQRIAKYFLPGMFLFLLVSNMDGAKVEANQPKGLPKADVSAFQSQSYQKIDKTADLPLPVRKALDLVDDPKSMADPGKNWSVGCTGGPGAPHRRLILAAKSNDYCIVYYECGGIAHFYYQQLYKLKDDKVLWSVQKMGNRECKTLDDVKAALVKNDD